MVGTTGVAAGIVCGVTETGVRIGLVVGVGPTAGCATGPAAAKGVWMGFWFGPIRLPSYAWLIVESGQTGWLLLKGVSPIKPRLIHQKNHPLAAVELCVVSAYDT